MIKEISFKNYFSFKEGATVSFLMNKKVPKEYYRVNNLTTVMGIKGANGSGKTNILRAIGFLSYFVTKSADKDVGEPIYLDSYFRNSHPSEFLIEFISDNGTEYIYEVSVNDKQVLREKISRKKVRKVEIIYREGGKIVSCIKELEELNLFKFF